MTDRPFRPLDALATFARFTAFAVFPALLAVSPALAAAPDDIVEWAGVSHLAWQDRRPLCPVDGESFAVRFQTWKNDIAAAQLLVTAGASTTPAVASKVATRGPYDVWQAQVPATVATTESYVIELTDGADVDEIFFARFDLEFGIGAAPHDAVADEGYGHMGVAEEAQGRGQVSESLLGVEIAEDVIVLVERRPMADGELAVDRLGPLGQAPEVLGEELVPAHIGKTGQRGGSHHRHRYRQPVEAVG